MTSSAREYWNAQVDSFDDEPDHGLADPTTRAAWRRLLLDVLPTPPADVADLGCGTGTLAVLLAEHGFRVQGVDIADKMVSAAQRKAQHAGVAADFHLGDAADPPLEAASYDVVLSRHVLWAIDDPAAALRRWVALLRPSGMLVLVEGFWATGAGLQRAEAERLVLDVRDTAEVQDLSDPVYWGGPIDDERYLLVSGS